MGLALLEVVASGEEWPIRAPPPPVAQRVAAAAGAPGQIATDASPTARVSTPEGSAKTVPVPSVALTVRCKAPMATVPAVTAPPTIPPANVELFVGRWEYADVVRQPSQPQSARSRPGVASGVGDVRQGQMVVLPKHALRALPACPLAQLLPPKGPLHRGRSRRYRRGKLLAG